MCIVLPTGCQPESFVPGIYPQQSKELWQMPSEFSGEGLFLSMCGLSRMVILGLQNKRRKNFVDRSFCRPGLLYSPFSLDSIVQIYPVWKN